MLDNKLLAIILLVLIGVFATNAQTNTNAVKVEEPVSISTGNAPVVSEEPPSDGLIQSLQILRVEEPVSIPDNGSAPTGTVEPVLNGIFRNTTPPAPAQTKQQPK